MNLRKPLQIQNKMNRIQRCFDHLGIGINYISIITMFILCHIPLWKIISFLPVHELSALLSSSDLMHLHQNFIKCLNLINLIVTLSMSSDIISLINSAFDVMNAAQIPAKYEAPDPMEIEDDQKEEEKASEINAIDDDECIDVKSLSDLVCYSFPKPQGRFFGPNHLYKLVNDFMTLINGFNVRKQLSYHQEMKLVRECKTCNQTNICTRFINSFLINHDDGTSETLMDCILQCFEPETVSIQCDHDFHTRIELNSYTPLLCRFFLKSRQCLRLTRNLDFKNIKLVCQLLEMKRDL